MQYEITDAAAVEFARGLYEALAEGIAVDVAVAEARKSISLSVANTVEWGTPVLHMRSPDGILFEVRELEKSSRKVKKRRAPKPSRPQTVAALATVPPASTSSDSRWRSWMPDWLEVLWEIAWESWPSRVIAMFFLSSSLFLIWALYATTGEAGRVHDPGEREALADPPLSEDSGPGEPRTKPLNRKTALGPPAASKRNPSRAARDSLAAAELVQRARALYGPISAVVEESEINVTMLQSHTELADFVAQADFYNPSGAKPWSYGFLFRWTGWTYPHYRLFVSSDGSWSLQLIETSTAEKIGKFRELHGGQVSDINLQAGGVNTLRAAVRDTGAYFFVNRTFIGRLRLTGVSSKGDILVGAGFRAGDGSAGRTVRFERFRVSSLEP
jgi:hypothetical protein